MLPQGIRRHHLAVSFASLVLLAGLGTKTIHAATNQTTTYLALGDSVAYGLNILILPPISKTVPAPSAFVGYPEVLTNWMDAANPRRRILELNLSCPGETSGSFLDVNAPDYGCNDAGPQGQPPFKSWVGLHTTYTQCQNATPLTPCKESQMSMALTELKANNNINLITLNIGANDFLLLIGSCTDASGNLSASCMATGVPQTAQNLGGNLANILGQIRGAGYKGKLVVLLQYSPTAALIPVAQAINGALAAASAPFGVTLADGFTAFQIASLPAGGDPCKAGLLVSLGAAGCDIHPSPLGQQVLAATIFLTSGIL